MEGHEDDCKERTYNFCHKFPEFLNIPPSLHPAKEALCEELSTWLFTTNILEKLNIMSWFTANSIV